MKVLFVCTANRIRSPMAEAIAQSATGPVRVLANVTGQGHIVVGGAGTRARDGDPMDPYAHDALRGLGIEPNRPAHAFRSRPLTGRLIAAADLVLTMETAHRSAVVTMEPGALRRVFTLREFARLLAAAPAPAPWQAEWVEAAAERRGRVPAPAPGLDDIADPVGQGPAAYANCAALILSALASLSIPACPAAPPSSP